LRYQRFVNQHFHQPDLDGQSVRIDLGDFVAQGREQALRVGSSFGIARLAGQKPPPCDAAKQLRLFRLFVGIFSCPLSSSIKLWWSRACCSI
jgi:hypothetical protein